MKCDFCKINEGIYQCTCDVFLCSDKCIRRHTGGVTIEEMKELEGEFEGKKK